MANMGYCRFENTSRDLADVWDHWDDELESDEENDGKRAIIQIARNIVEEEGAED